MVGQMAIGQVDGKRKLLEAICSLILGFIGFCFFLVSAFCFNFLKAERKVGNAESGKLKVGN